jgi:signal transduction histidine kinase
MKWPRSLRARLVAGAIAWVLCASLIGGVALSYAFKSAAEEVFDSRLTSLVAILIGLVDATPTGELHLARNIGDPEFERVYSGWYWVVKANGATRLRSRSLWDLDLPSPQLAVSATPRVWTTKDSLGHEIRVAAQSVLIPGVDQPLTFMVTGDARLLQAEARRFNWVLRAALAALGIGLILAILIQVTFGLKPLQRLANQAEAVRSGASDELARTGTPEIDALVNEVNSLIRHNRQVVERSRAAAADLAHALKTPLAILQSEDVQHSSVDREQLASMERIIARHLARAATIGPGRHAQVAIAPILEDLTRGLSRVYADKNVQVAAHLSDMLSYAADREDLEEILGNLMENAFKWARSSIRISADRRDQQMRIVIEDDGPGMDNEDAVHAAERGTRFDERTPGTGLGLSIVTDIASIYGGSLQLSRSELGGLRVELMLPL